MASFQPLAQQSAQLLRVPAEVRSIIFELTGSSLHHAICKCDNELTVISEQGSRWTTAPTPPFRTERQSLDNAGSRLDRQPLLRVCKQSRREIQQQWNCKITLSFQLSSCPCISTFLMACSARQRSIVDVLYIDVPTRHPPIYELLRHYLDSTNSKRPKGQNRAERVQQLAERTRGLHSRPSGVRGLQEEMQKVYTMCRLLEQAFTLDGAQVEEPQQTDTHRGSRVLLVRLSQSA